MVCSHVKDKVKYDLPGGGGSKKHCCWQWLTFRQPVRTEEVTGLVQSFEVVKKSWNLPSNFPGLKKVFNNDKKSWFFLKSYNKWSNRWTKSTVLIRTVIFHLLIKHLSPVKSYCSVTYCSEQGGSNLWTPELWSWKLVFLAMRPNSLMFLLTFPCMMFLGCTRVYNVHSQ